MVVTPLPDPKTWGLLRFLVSWDSLSHGQGSTATWDLLDNEKLQQLAEVSADTYRPDYILQGRARARERKVTMQERYHEGTKIAYGGPLRTNHYKTCIEGTFFPYVCFETDAVLSERAQVQPAHSRMKPRSLCPREAAVGELGKTFGTL
ncbi:hypothetical protein TWF506_000196 [Arthrobotrys conoides]|uniref:Uncharacterized protein n=1 Tax=Arthrobotrys conoides TaxID=74498 RepID=A0AAN8RXC5_9PEZI